MQFFKIDLQGKFWMQRAALPVWAGADEGRLIYDNVNKKVYYANDTEWVQISDAVNPGPAVYS